MISFKLSLRPGELMPLSNFISKLLTISSRSPEYIDYTDFYNIRHFCKLLFDKHYSVQHKNVKKVLLNVNINIYDSILHLYNINGIELNKPENNFLQFIYRESIFQMDKQRVNLNEYKLLN